MNLNCNKEKYPTQALADADIIRIGKTSKRVDKPVRSYLCSCGFWHTTSRSDKHNDKLNKIHLEYNTNVAKLKKEITELKTELEYIKNNKEILVLAKESQIIKDLQNANAKLRDRHKKVIKNNYDLINKIVKLTQTIYKYENENYNQ